MTPTQSIKETNRLHLAIQMVGCMTEESLTKLAEAIKAEAPKRKDADRASKAKLEAKEASRKAKEEEATARREAQVQAQLQKIADKAERVR